MDRTNEYEKKKKGKNDGKIMGERKKNKSKRKNEIRIKKRNEMRKKRKW